MFCACPIISDCRYCSIFVKRGEKKKWRGESKTLVLNLSCPLLFSKSNLCNVVSVYEFVSVRTRPSFLGHVRLFLEPSPPREDFRP